MKVLVVRQPWAWMIVNGHKDIENRTWDTKHRGPMLIQAGGTRPSKPQLERVRQYARERGVRLPEDFELGGIVGMVRLNDCPRSSRSVWWEPGNFAWVLSHPKRLRFVPMKGMLNLVDAPQKIVRKLTGIRGGKIRGISSR